MKRYLLTMLLVVFVLIEVNAQKAELANDEITNSNLTKDLRQIVSTPGGVLIPDFSLFKAGSPIFEQHDLITHEGQGSGGADVSATQGSLLLSTLGAGFQASLGNSMADDFTVPTSETWNIDGFTFYGYQTGSPIDPSTFTDVLVRVYDGNPSSGGAVIQDFWTGGIMVSSYWTGIYRTTEDNIATATDRPIMYLNCEVPEFQLTEGQYWIEWAASGTGASGPWTPPITILGETTTGDAYQYTTAWAPFTDGGTLTPQGVCFDILGSITTTAVVNRIDSEKISISPNPSNGVFNIYVDRNFNLEIFNITGKLIKNEVLTGNTTVQIEDAGLYFLRFSNKQGFLTHRVVVR